MITPIVMSIRDYLGNHGSVACFACGCVSEPLPRNPGDREGREARCSECNQESALVLSVAAGEGWLRVLDDDGRVLNDTRQSTTGVR